MSHTLVNAAVTKSVHEIHNRAIKKIWISHAIMTKNVLYSLTPTRGVSACKVQALHVPLDLRSR